MSKIKDFQITLVNLVLDLRYVFRRYQYVFPAHDIYPVSTPDGNWYIHVGPSLLILLSPSKKQGSLYPVQHVDIANLSATEGAITAETYPAPVLIQPFDVLALAVYEWFETQVPQNK